jgi:hypothetical protein
VSNEQEHLNDSQTSSVDADGAQGLHACQGLDPTGTNDCATAVAHDCANGNACRGQGGCGLAATPPPTNVNWIPNQNSCKGKGGCGAPIPPAQVFNANPSNGEVAPPNLQNKSVWEYAREQMGFTEPLAPSYGRASLKPTSPVYPPKTEPSE